MFRRIKGKNKAIKILQERYGRIFLYTLGKEGILTK